MTDNINSSGTNKFDLPKPELYDLFKKSIKSTLFEIKKGADSRNFGDLVVINLIIDAAREGYEAPQIREFINKLSEDEPESMEDDG